jgi:tRNA-Thr(GGU) m(6)t(6)A37 methyltransferase TsaA
MEIAVMITLNPIGVVESERTDTHDDNWGDVESVIELRADLPAESLAGLEDFSHAEVVFVFDRIDEPSVVTGTRHPRDNSRWPKVGIFAQRASRRPNRLGVTIVTVLGRDGSRLRVKGLDAVDGTPVVDIKPVMAEFLPREPVRQPAWSHELMRHYWRKTE